MGKKSSNGGRSGTQSKPPALARVVVQALQAVGGADAERSAVEEWIGANYPGLSYNENTLNTTLSGARKKLRGGAPAPGRGRRRSAEPSVQELLEVKHQLEKHGGVEGFRKLFTPVLELIDRAGGVDRLKECLSALEKIRS
jgi:hypothetical protein